MTQPDEGEVRLESHATSINILLLVMLVTSSLPRHHFISTQFIVRHIGPRESTDVGEMLKVIGFDSMDGLIDSAVPRSIREHRKLAVPGPCTEQETLSASRSVHTPTLVRLALARAAISAVVGDG